MIVAAVEHAVRRFRCSLERAIAEAATGFSNREAGDFLTDADQDDPETLRAMQTPAADATAARPAGEDARTDLAAPPVGHPVSAVPPAADDDPAAGPALVPAAGSLNFGDLLRSANPDDVQVDWRSDTWIRVPSAAVTRNEADERITRELAAAGFKAGEDFAAEFGEVRDCRHCDKQIRVNDRWTVGHSESLPPYHVESGMHRCADRNTFASPK